MSRLHIIDASNANAEQHALLEAIQAQLGMVPNFLKVFANSPVALKAFLGLHGVAGAGSLDAATQERIALALAQQNGCEYCVSAHTTIGRQSGLSDDDMAAARAGSSTDPRAAEAVRFARRLMASQGDVNNADLMAVRAAGYSDADLVEIITHVGMNFLTNVLGKASRVDIDFPRVSLNAVG